MRYVIPSILMATRLRSEDGGRSGCAMVGGGSGLALAFTAPPFGGDGLGVRSGHMAGEWETSSEDILKVAKRRRIDPATHRAVCQVRAGQERVGPAARKHVC